MKIQDRPYVFAVPVVGDNKSFSLLIPKGFNFLLNEIRVVRRSDIQNARLILNSAARSLSSMSVPVFSDLLSVGKVNGSVISIVPQETYFLDGDQIFGTTYGMNSTDKMCFVGKLIKNEN